MQKEELKKMMAAPGNALVAFRIYGISKQHILEIAETKTDTERMLKTLNTAADIAQERMQKYAKLYGYATSSYKGIVAENRPEINQNAMEHYKHMMKENDTLYRSYMATRCHILDAIDALEIRLKGFESKSERLKASVTMLPENVDISVCTANASENRLEITGWYTQQSHQKQGFGRACMANVLERFLQFWCTCVDDAVVTYTWNGQNQYVLKWLESMGAESLEDPAAKKYCNEDTWDNHMYKIPIRNLMAKLSVSKIPE